LLLQLLLIATASALHAEDDADPRATRGSSSNENPYIVSRATSEIRVDGTLDEPAWADALVIPLNYEWLPGDGVEPPVRTEALLTFDDRQVYFAFRAYDPEPQKIRAHLMDRDDIQTFVQDDHVTLIIDSFNEDRRAIQLRVNPLGVQADALFSETSGFEDFAWDIIWKSAGRVTEEGYIVELSIPLNQLPFPKTQGAQTWGVELGRSYPRSIRHRITANYRDRDNSCVLCQNDRVKGWDQLSRGLNLEINPTLTGFRVEEVDATGNLVPTDDDAELGLTANWGITSNTRLGATLNPDFSDIEADVRQIAINQQFALFFPEQRPFFLQGIDLFITPENLIFTRTIVDPAWGLRFGGKQGRNDFGVFAARDRLNRFIIPGNQGSTSELIDESVQNTVLRYRRDVGKTSTAGLLVTDRDGEGDYRNRVASLDSFMRLDKKNTVTVQYSRSDTRYPAELAPANPTERGPCGDAGTLECSGDSIFVDWDYNSRNWFASSAYIDRDPGFRADMGFVPRVDMRRLDAVAVRTFWAPEGAAWTQAGVGVFGFRTENHAGELTDSHGDLFANFTGPLQSFVEVSLQSDRKLYIDTRYDDLQRVQVFGQVQPNGALNIELFADVGDSIDFTNDQPADLFLFDTRIEAKLGRHINLQLLYTHQTLDVAGGRLFTVDLPQLRFVYQFNVRAFIRAIVQYQDLTQDPGLYFRVCDGNAGSCTPLAPEDRPPPRSQDLFTELLFSYRLNARSVLFVGLTDVQAGGDTLDPIARRYFMKASYAWLF
jgi:hypothetical protein